ncbi:hypothetical protein GpartN1_g7666.t1 [Galdieria partita]|uniref:7-cyano-7-deazaguanine synthase n=1 Tax=Galdieria partita TaxID=83374 RepID=A0A9C7Q4N3_9RHOD|nr:hypothetical protein GpartN1_g7666.t1 [Galdieria partita]
MKRLFSSFSAPKRLKFFACYYLKKSTFSTSSSAVVLLSGGADSATTLAVAVRDGFEVYALSFDYGQRHRQELLCARRIAECFRCREHRIAQIDLRVFGGSALTNSDLAVPKDRQDRASVIPVTYVPARNTIFLSYALSYAEVIGASDIFIGANAVDYSGYPDCRPLYFQIFEQLASVGTKAGVEQGIKYKIHTPLLHLSKAEIIQLGIRLGVDYGMTHSCYDPGEEGKPCGRCDACCIRQEAFKKLGFVRDPALERFHEN